MKTSALQQHIYCTTPIITITDASKHYPSYAKKDYSCISVRPHCDLGLETSNTPEAPKNHASVTLPITNVTLALCYYLITYEYITRSETVLIINMNQSM